MSRVVTCFVLAGCVFAAAPKPVDAATITFNAGTFDLISIGNNGQGPDPNFDELHVAAFTDTFTITVADGVVHRDVNPFTYIVGNTGPDSDLGPLADFAVPRSFSVNGGAAQNITQMGQVDIGFFEDTYEFFVGATVTFDLGADGFLDVTPDAFAIAAGDGGILTASFQLRAAADPGLGAAADAPEPASMFLLGTGLLGIGGLRRWRKRQRAT